MPRGQWRVEIVEYSTESVVRTLRYPSEHLADKGDAGVNRNLNHERFYTRIIEPPAATRDQNRDAAGRYDTEPRCDFCGGTCGARVGSHYTDAEVCGVGDGPGFYLCGRKLCIARREQLPIDKRRILYGIQRKRNEQKRKDGKRK